MLGAVVSGHEALQVPPSIAPIRNLSAPRWAKPRWDLAETQWRTPEADERSQPTLPHAQGRAAAQPITKHREQQRQTPPPRPEIKTQTVANGTLAGGSNPQGWSAETVGERARFRIESNIVPQRILTGDPRPHRPGAKHGATRRCGPPNHRQVRGC